MVELFKHNETWINSTIIQEIIPGDDSNIYQCTSFLSHESDVLFSFTMQKIRQYPTNFGVTSYGISRDIDDLKTKTNDLLQNIGYKGVASLEFKWDSIRKRFVFIELNCRLPYYNSLFNASGANLPYIIFQYLTLAQFQKYETHQKEDVNWVNFRYDFITFIHNFVRKKLHFSEWCRQLLKASAFAVWDKDDMKPFIYSMKEQIIGFINTR